MESAFSDELVKTLAAKGVTGCHGQMFGFFIGHLCDHGLTDTEIHLFVEQLLARIRKVQSDPEKLAALRQFYNGL